ncbi:MAG TPA: M1 family metallopeptidase [Hanamia sp.]|nr:M1 family metallopeptidase [Hanamia sp.]
MKKPISFSISFFFFFINTSFAQQLFTNTKIQNAYKNETRSPTGKPGKNYWQNRANYQINVSFDPATQLLHGSETINYENNSPDTLKQIIIRLYPDLYKKGVERLSHIAEKDLGDGVQIESFKIGDEMISDFHDRQKAYHRNILLYIRPSSPVLPHSKTKFEIAWHYKVNTGSPVRTGMVDSTSYFIAYFFPRVAVYDDIDGWDTWSYNGEQEFYNDFGNFNVQISVPENYVVWATGDRENSQDNFSNNILEKMKEASVSTKIIHVIDSSDYNKKDVLKNDATGIWKFSATNVTDFAFALSDHYLWDVSSVVVDSSTGRRTLAEAAYNKIHLDYFDVANQTHQTVYYTSYFYPKYPFPFNHITVFDGTDQMEYPMMVNDNPTRTHEDAVQLTTHEIFHSYFPFFMGTNETQCAWMDEGWATIGESVISPKMGEPEDEGIFSKVRYEKISGTDNYVPLITNTKLYSGAAYLANSYGKAGLCYYVLQDLLGDKLYFKALHHYMNDWHGKHPDPYDFFYSINDGSGKNLDWFWQKWFFGWAYPDLAIKEVEKKGNGTKIIIENKGGLPLPVVLNIFLKDGKKLIKKYTAEVWKEGDKEKTFHIPQLYSSISKIELGDQYIPDKYMGNNSWKAKG